MKRLLRYNSRHTLWFPRGYEGKWMPQLNPIKSCSHGANGRRTWRLTEPRRVYQLRRRLFGYAGEGEGNPHGGGYQWHRGPDGFRTCSCCGSLHFDDFMEVCRRALTDERYGVSGSTKAYKKYVTQPGVRNASEGAIKFYTDHSPEHVSEADGSVYAEAERLSAIRYDAMLKKMREGWAR